MKRVYRAATLLEVAHARNLLVAAGIDCEIRNQFLAGAVGELPALETWPQVYVEDDDEVRALRTLVQSRRPPSGSAWVCAGCGEELEPQFTHCWRCGREADDRPT